jgi:hypothetical protein
MGKKIWFVLPVVTILILGVILPLEASVRLGARLGLINSRCDLSGELSGIQMKSISGISGGVFLGLDFGRGRFGIQPEVLYGTKGFDARESYQGEDVSSQYEIDYIEIPVLFSFRVISGRRINLALLFGPYFGIPLEVREIQTLGGHTEERTLDGHLNNTDAGVAMGLDLGYRLRSISFILAARFHWGLTSITRNIQAMSAELDADDTIKNHSLSLMVGLAFDLRRRR